MADIAYCSRSRVSSVSLVGPRLPAKAVASPQLPCACRRPRCPAAQWPRMAAAARGAGASAAPLRRTSFGKVEQAATSVMEHTTEFEAFESLPCGVGDVVKGPLFQAGGHEWRLAVYPGGIAERTQAYAAVFLYYKGTRDGVSASYDIEVTHSAFPGTVRRMWDCPSKLFATRTDESKSWVLAWGAAKALKRSKLDGKTGTLTVKCVLTVAEGERRTTLVAGPQKPVAV
eukprot:COSAG01_NODE_6612_length_3574_cov_1.760207_7_plen_228_part_01